MTKSLLGTGNGEEVARARSKVDFREDFDPLQKRSGSSKTQKLSDQLTPSLSLAGSGPVTEKRACTEACGASFPTSRSGGEGHEFEVMGIHTVEVRGINVEAHNRPWCA